MNMKGSKFLDKISTLHEYLLATSTCHVLFIDTILEWNRYLVGPKMKVFLPTGRNFQILSQHVNSLVSESFSPNTPTVSASLPQGPLAHLICDCSCEIN